MIQRKRGGLLMVALLVSFDASGSELKASGSGLRVEFQAIGRPSALKVKGKSEDASGVVQAEKNRFTGTFSLPVKSLKTGIELRDRHLQEKYLDAEKFPLILLQVKGDLPSSGEGLFEGELDLHGKKVPVKGALAGYVMKEGKASFSASFSISLSQFEIAIPKYLGITIADRVDVTVDAQLK